MAGARDVLPAARINFDRFHVLKLLHEAVETAAARRAPEFKRTRYLWLRNQSRQTPREQLRFERLVPGRSQLRTVRAYQMKPAFQDLWELSARQTGEELLAERRSAG